MDLPFGGKNILEPVATPDLPDPQPGTAEYDFAILRHNSTRSIDTMPWLAKPQDSDEWAKELYERLEEAERKFIAPNLLESEYIEGTAVEPDEIAVVRSDTETPYLFSAEHATSPFSVKKNRYRFADKGTGGLAAVMAEDFGTAVIMKGRQTTGVVTEEAHPFKDVLRKELAAAAGFIAIHAKSPGMFIHPDDQAEIHACLGLGLEPTEAEREFARRVVLAARDDLGLYAVISNDQPAYIQKPDSTELKRLENGLPKLSQLAALNPKMTTNVSRSYFRELGLNNHALQIELSPMLRITPPGVYEKDRKSRIIGAALGYKLLEKVVQLSFVDDYEEA